MLVLRAAHASASASRDGSPSSRNPSAVSHASSCCVGGSLTPAVSLAPTDSSASYVTPVAPIVTCTTPPPGTATENHGSGRPCRDRIVGVAEKLNQRVSRKPRIRLGVRDPIAVVADSVIDRRPADTRRQHVIANVTKRVGRLLHKAVREYRVTRVSLTPARDGSRPISAASLVRSRCGWVGRDQRRCAASAMRRRRVRGDRRPAVRAGDVAKGFRKRDRNTQAGNLDLRHHPRRILRAPRRLASQNSNAEPARDVRPSSVSGTTSPLPNGDMARSASSRPVTQSGGSTVPPYARRPAS